jgi:hypothetical protein
LLWWSLADLTLHFLLYLLGILSVYLLVFLLFIVFLGLLERGLVKAQVMEA